MYIYFPNAKLVVRDCFGKQMLAMFADIVQIVMLETAEPSRMEVYEDDNDLCIAHAVWLASVALTINRASSIDFSCCASKNLQNSSAKQKISVTFARKDNSLRINRLVGLLENWVTR